MTGLKPTTLSDPSGFCTVSFFAYCVSSRDRLRRPVQPRLLEHVLVVVEAHGVGQHRQRAAGALVLRVGARGGREDRVADLVALEVGLEVDPCAGAAERAGVVGRERLRDVGRLAAAARRDDLVVVDAADDADLDAGVERLEVLDGVLEDAQLALGEADPERDVGRLELRRRLLRPACRVARVAAAPGHRSPRPPQTRAARSPRPSRSASSSPPHLVRNLSQTRQ